LRLIHAFAGNTPQLPTASANTGPQIFVYANGAKLNGNALSYGGQWPSPSVYASVPATGNVRFDIVLARLNFSAVPVIPAPIMGDTLLTVNHTLAAGKRYSLYFGDSTGGPYRFELFEDNIVPAAAGNYRIRLANWSMNKTDTLSVYSVRQQAVIIPNTTIKTISNWVELPISPVADTLQVRNKTTGVTTWAAVNGLVAAPTRNYTLVTRGKTGVTSKGASVGLLTNY
jgi:hypothetical protein